MRISAIDRERRAILGIYERLSIVNKFATMAARLARLWPFITDRKAAIPATCATFHRRRRILRFVHEVKDSTADARVSDP